MNAKELTALKAVFYGCGTNKRLDSGAFYFNRTTKEKIYFSEALEIVGDMIEREEASNAE